MQHWIKALSLFFVLGFLVYFNSLNNKFIIDDFNFINNPSSSHAISFVSQWNPYREQVRGVLETRDAFRYYRPMQHMVLDSCYAAFKDHYWQYHLLNLFLFVLATSLIYVLIGKLSGQRELAFLTGLFYLIHPINGIIVNYISASVFPLQVIFMTATILLLWRSLEVKNKRMSYFFSLLFYFLSLFWHESGIMIPFYVSAVVLLFRKDTLHKKFLTLFPYFLIVIAYILFRYFFLSVNEIVVKQISLFHMTVGEYLAGLFQVFGWYIGKLFYPQGIVMQWAAPIPHEHIFLKVLGLFLFLMFFVLLFVRSAKQKILQLAVVWIVIGFIPAILAAILRSKDCLVIEPHWFVFSSIGFFILAASLCLSVLKWSKKVGVFLICILIFIWGAVSHSYNRLWADQKTYATYWSQHSSLQVINSYLARAYLDEGAWKESEKFYLLALTGSSSDKDIYVNLGFIYQSEGRFKDAESTYQMVLKIDPNSSGAYFDLGYLYYAEGEIEKAKDCLEHSLILNPVQTEPRRVLAFISLSHSDYQEAIDLCLKNLEFVDHDGKTLYLLVDIFIQKKDLDNVKKYAYRFINSQSDPSSLTSLGVVLAQNDFPAIALDCFEKALRVEPNYSDAYLDTGVLFFNLHQYDKAFQIWEAGSKVAPSDQRFKRKLASLKS